MADQDPTISSSVGESEENGEAPHVLQVASEGIVSSFADWIASDIDWSQRGTPVSFRGDSEWELEPLEELEKYLPPLTEMEEESAAGGKENISLESFDGGDVPQVRDLSAGKSIPSGSGHPALSETTAEARMDNPVQELVDFEKLLFLESEQFKLQRTLLQEVQEGASPFSGYKMIPESQERATCQQETHPVEQWGESVASWGGHIVPRETMAWAVTETGGDSWVSENQGWQILRSSKGAKYKEMENAWAQNVPQTEEGEMGDQTAHCSDRPLCLPPIQQQNPFEHRGDKQPIASEGTPAEDNPNEMLESGKIDSQGTVPADTPACQGKEEKPMCLKCGKYFTTKRGLKLHGSVHSNEKPYRCSICSKAFARMQYLSVHQKIHKKNNTNYCSYCGKSFLNFLQLKVHEKKSH